VRNKLSDEDESVDVVRSKVFENKEVPAAENFMTSDNDSSAAGNGVTQAQVYDNLKRIGELEDEKKRIQEEIQNRTEQLREVIGHIDRGSILYKMLESALRDFKPSGATASSAKKAAKRASRASKKKSHS
jgi:hypothetical protein